MPKNDSPLIKRRLEKTAQRVKDAERQLEEEVKLATREGWSLRQIAEVVGLSHEGVRSILRQRP